MIYMREAQSLVTGLQSGQALQLVDEQAEQHSFVALSGVLTACDKSLPTEAQIAARAHSDKWMAERGLDRYGRKLP